MKNFTPLKKKKNKLLIFGNIFLFLLIFSITGIIYKDQLITTVQKAIGPKWQGPVPDKEFDGLGKNQIAEGCVVEDKVCDASGHCTYRAVGRLKNCVGKGSKKITQDQPTSTPEPTTTTQPTIEPTITSAPTDIPPTDVPPTDIPPTDVPPTDVPPTITPIAVPCGTKDCDDVTNPCRSGYVCIQSSNGSNYCSSPDFTNACRANPTYNNCCTEPNAPTATNTIAPTAVASLPSTGKISPLMLIPIAIIIGGLLL